MALFIDQNGKLSSKTGLHSYQAYLAILVATTIEQEGPSISQLDCLYLHIHSHPTLANMPWEALWLEMETLSDWAGEYEAEALLLWAIDEFPANEIEATINAVCQILCADGLWSPQKGIWLEKVRQNLQLNQIEAQAVLTSALSKYSVPRVLLPLNDMI